MKIQLSSLIVSLLLAGTTTIAAGSSSQLMPASSQDQVPLRLQSTTNAGLSTAHLDREPAAMSWPIDSSAPLDGRPTPFQQQSREYWVDASADELRGGFGISTSANGALVRLSPHAGNLSAIDASSLSFRANGKLHTGTDAIRSLADQDALRAAGMDVPEGSLVMKLADALGSGRIELIAPTASGSYLVHVFEPDSKVVMSLQAERDTAFAGETMRIRADIRNATLDNVRGLLSSPNGHSQEVDFQRQADGSYLANVRPDASHAGRFGLWEIHAFGNASTGRTGVPRDARSAFAVSVPTARLDGSIEKHAGVSKDHSLTLSIGVQAELASRYQLAGTLYGSRADGSLAPAAIGHSAAWLESGNASITLHFDAETLAQSGMGAPYELRDLRLLNQLDMSLIERRERAARID